MVEYETIKSEEIKFGNNDFIEIARKIAKSESGQNEFISISRGFFMMDGSKDTENHSQFRYKKKLLNLLLRN